MSTNPQVYGPDGVLRTEASYSTTLESKFVQGTIPLDTVDVQVSINGAGWSSDTNLIEWGDGDWTVPNPASEPNGLLLLPGANIIQVRAIRSTGSTTLSAKATISLVSDSDLGSTASAPTNIKVAQENNSVTIQSESSEDEGFRGMLFYASQYPGGGADGYTRINVDMVSEGSLREETTDWATLEATPDVLVDSEGDPVADPMIYRVATQQEDEDETVLQVDINETFEVPESARDLQVFLVLKTIREITVYEFAHSRSAGPSSTPSTVRVGSFATLPSNTPLFYVVTAVYYDSAQNLEYESAHSAEVSGHPSTVTTALASIPTVSRQAIVQEYVKTVFRSNPQIKLESGSFTRDTGMDPFSYETERVRFLVDFFNRARVPELLLQIDDPNGTGTSVPVSQSPYKLALQAALYLSSPADVQAIIDGAFEAYASNYGETRLSGTASQGQATFFTTKKPTRSIPIPLGSVISGGGVQFATTRASSIDFERLASFHNPTTGRYQVTVPIRCLTVGTSGNLAAGQINTVVSSLGGGLSVVNASDLIPGEDVESNLALTVRVRNSLASVDSGTERGYFKTAARVAGVQKVDVISAGEALMQRDLEDGVHRGGKVDIWVQGSKLATVTDTFSFSFEIGTDIQFVLVGDPADLVFQALDPDLSEDNPIVEMLDDASAGYEFKNVTTGEAFDLTGVSVTAFDRIQLSTAVSQPSVSLTDVVLGSYRRRVGNTFVLPRQPVSEITSVVGSVSGTLPDTAVLLVHPDAPLETGRSTLAKDYLQITAYTDDDGNQVPSGETISETDESHVLVGQYAEFLDNLGANYLTIVVKDSTGTITYKGPDDPSGDPDYTVTLGTQTVPVSITRTETGDIPSGATVLVSYDHDENFTVTYKINLVVSLTQDAIDADKHSTADVIVKDAIPIPMDIDATVVLVRGREQSTVGSAIRTNLKNFFANLRLGDPVRQSDIIKVIEDTEGVSYVVVPLTRMVPASGATFIREGVSTDTASESTLVTSLSTNQASVYLLNNGLLYDTTDGGGADGSFKAVFQDDVAMELLDASTSLSGLGAVPNRAYILGSEGRSILGISDDVTLEAAGYVTDSAKEERRKELTANHILVSLAVGSSPVSTAYSATYVSTTGTGAKNVDPGAAQYVSQGTLEFTYDEER